MFYPGLKKACCLRKKGTFAHGITTWERGLVLWGHIAHIVGSTSYVSNVLPFMCCVTLLCEQFTHKLHHNVINVNAKFWYVNDFWANLVMYSCLYCLWWVWSIANLLTLFYPLQTWLSNLDCVFENAWDITYSTACGCHLAEYPRQDYCHKLNVHKHAKGWC